jgi:hypothetical protein
LNKILEIDEFLLELDEDVEGMQNTIYYLQQQLKEAKEKLAKLENSQQNDSVLQNLNNNLDNNQISSQQLSSIDRTNERTFEMRAEVSDTHQEVVAINGPNIDSIDSDINNETLDSVESNEEFMSSNDMSTVSETEVNQNSIKNNNNNNNNNNNYLSLVNESNNLINECNNKRTSCFDEEIDIDDDDYKEPIGKVAKLNEDISGNTSKLIITSNDSNDNSQHSNDMTTSELTSLQNNCIEINGTLNQ